MMTGHLFALRARTRVQVTRANTFKDKLSAYLGENSDWGVTMAFISRSSTKDPNSDEVRSALLYSCAGLAFAGALSRCKGKVMAQHYKASLEECSGKVLTGASPWSSPRTPTLMR
jgi:hypothetical protein